MRSMLRRERGIRIRVSMSEPVRRSETVKSGSLMFKRLLISLPKTGSADVSRPITTKTIGTVMIRPRMIGAIRGEAGLVFLAPCLMSLVIAGVIFSRDLIVELK